MLFKSKSVITVIGLGLFALVCVIAGALILNSPDITEFSTDGYILSASAEEGAENVMVSEQIWFGQGSSWKEGKEEVRFSDAQGDSVQVPTDSFIHYSDNSLSAVTDVSVMSLDDYAQGKIQYYVLKQGVPMKWNGAGYTIGEGADAISFSNFIMKSSEEHYLLGGESLNLIQNNGQAAHVDNGYLELEYLADDKSVALLNDGTNAWQILTEGAVIELKDGTTMNLSKGQLELPEQADGQTLTGYYLDDMEINVSRKNFWNNQNGYPVYRFTILNGEDGADGTDGAAGEDGETGEDGEEGEQGTDGSSEQSGAAGANGNSGGSGTTGAAGASGGQMSGVNVSTSIPVVSLRSWSVTGKGLKFTVYTDEVSCNSINEGTTRISLVDTNTGKEVYWWSKEGDLGGTGQEIDLSEDSADGFELYCNVLDPGHQYRLTVSAEYTVNDATGSQILLTRNFTADDYGISFELTDKTSDTFTFALKTSNQLVSVNSIAVYVDGEIYDTMNQGEYDGFTIDLKKLHEDVNKDHANQTHEISFRPIFTVTSFDETGSPTSIEVGEDGSIRYDYTVTTLKNEPTVGGIRLTAYDSGYMLAEVLGKHDGNKYADVSDPDETIDKIRFELYSSPDELQKGTSPIAVQESTSGYLAYFNVSEKTTDPIHVGQPYYVRAYYTYDDGSKEMTLPVKETYGRVDTTEEHEENHFAWDIAIPVSLVSTTLSFEGNDIYNTTLEEQSKTNKGITYNALSGWINATVSTNNRYVVSKKYPMELRISASPDYYQSLQYGGYDASSKKMQSLDEGNPEEDIHLSDAGILKIPVDLAGLRANTSYMFTLYGYEEIKGTYNRVTMGSVAVNTRPYKKIALKMEPSTDGIGVNLRLGTTDNAHNYYNIITGTYNTDENYKKNTDTAYRSLYSITFELYRNGTSTPLGTCKIVDSKTTDTDKNSIYEAYYGQNAAKTLENYKTKESKKGIVGVGKDNFPYYFVTADNQELKQGELTDGEYYIKASVAYDYTKMRYDTMNMSEAGEGPYTYYTYRSEESEYVNQLEIITESSSYVDSSDTSAPIKVEALPFAEPSQLKYDDNSYINVELLTNDKLGAYNGDNNQNSLYSTRWNADTIAGVQLTTKYLNDAETSTDTIAFYGFQYPVWKNIDSGDTPTAPDKKNKEDRYAFRCEIDLSANDAQILPKVWLLFYDEADLPKIDAASQDKNSGIYAEDPTGKNKGYSYRQRAKVNGEPVEIFYMKKDDFSRGQSYVFAYETLLSDYEFPDSSGASVLGDFNYPEDYYKQYKGTVYTKTNTLASKAISIKRQKPMVYASLEKTVLAFDGAADYWKVYADDPDDAIHWESMVQTAPDNHVVGSTGSSKGGIYDLYDIPIKTPTLGSEIEGDAQYLTFTFGTKEPVDVNTKTVYKGKDDVLTEEQLLNYIDQDKVSTIRSAMTDTAVDTDTDEFTDRGGMIQVKNLPAERMSYRLKVEYLLLDDIGYDSGSSYTCISVIEHNYIGKNDYSKKEDWLQLTKAVAADDHNTMYMYLNPSLNALDQDATLAQDLRDNNYKSSYYLGKEYQNKVRTIAAVSLNAYNETKDTYIFERDSETQKLLNEKKLLWLYPEAPGTTAEDYRYFLKFKLSDLDNTTGTDIQYHPGDQLKFEMTVYYLTGEGGIESTEYLTEGDYAIKYVNFIKKTALYGTTEKVDAAKYLFTSKTTTSSTSIGAGRSFYKLKADIQTKGTLPWTQQYIITSSGFDPACKDLKLSPVTLTADKGGVGASAMEVMKIASYQAPAQEHIAVQSAAPSLNNAKLTGGIVQVNLQANVENWNLVEYPGDEKLHLYYLIYNYTVGSDGHPQRGELVGAMVGEPAAADIITSGGKLSLTFPLLETKQKYWVEIYYKDKAAAGSDFNSKTDDALFGEVKHDPGTLYVTAVGGNSAAQGEALKIEEKIKGTDSVAADPTFKLINGINKRLLVETAEGLEISDVTLNLGNTNAYIGKKLNVTTKIKSDILEAERSALKIYYRLERCKETVDQENENNWKTVIAEKSDNVNNWETGIPDNEKYWSYYDTGMNGRDITLTPEVPQKDKNEMMVPYYAGGLIRPGYAYRIKAAIYQTSSTGDVLVSKEDALQPGGYRTSNIVNWKSISPEKDSQAMVQVTNVIRGSGSLKMDYRVNDLNNTSLDGRYFVRLAEKQEDGTYKPLEGTVTGADGTTPVVASNYYDRDTSGNKMNMAYTMGSTYQKVGFGLNQNYPLKSNTTYRLQFYALMDLDYDNKLDISDNDGLLNHSINTLPEIMTRDEYYPRADKRDVLTIPDTYSSLYKTLYKNMSTYDRVPDDLLLEKIGDTTDSLMIGYSDDITTLPEGETASAGTHLQTVVSDAHLVTLRFNGAYNAQDISRIVYSLVRENSDGSMTQWDTVTVDKPEGVTSMFDSTGSGSRNDGVEGKISLRLVLGNEEDKDSMNVKEKGKYYITLRMQRYDQDKKSYVTLGDYYSVKFNNTTEF